MENVSENNAEQQDDFVAPDGNPTDDAYMVTDTGVLYCPPAKDGKTPKPRKICGKLEVIAQAKDEYGQWGALLKFRDLDGIERQWIAPRRLFAGRGDELLKELLDKGLPVETSHGNEIRNYLLSRNPQRRIKQVSKTGWHDGSYILPDKTFGHNGDYLYSGSVNHYAQSGTLEEWRDKIAHYCSGNPLLVFQASAAFAGVLLKPSGISAGGFHVYGGSSKGKTTSSKIAASVWGDKTFMQSWRATSNGLEGVAVNYNDNTIPFDELKEASSQEVENIVYMLANGRGKGRANKEGDARKRKEWNALFLSTGEITLAQKAAGKLNAGAETRFAEIPVESLGGVFHELHGIEDQKALADHLADAVTHYYGTAGLAFLGAITADGGAMLADVAAEVKAIQQSFMPKDAGSQVGRVADRFALVAVAGEYATKFGITGWPEGEAVKAAQFCFNAWLDARGGTGDRERSAIIEQAIAFLNQHGLSRFANKDGGDNRAIINMAGYREAQEGVGVLYWVNTSTFEKEVCGGFNKRVACEALVDARILKPSKKEYTTQKKIAHENQRYYCMTIPDVAEG